ncbi:CDP-diacylglycerol--glycerol-3-phosphate 3-phosphatidyltransferase [Clostridium massiliamazoniense]|uniref:CDP-diacylglycerol--glycerol-3-phosphate 3-phosphatidyltransferase n=1 Tax=Clostridium massiliamazoniense TaxID=1347366 RepID=UPI0006D7FAC6|nr:CDP-diacylglycerol--glycerol-3-phosphate 3-phosphatidyltransferase [Clostridium massiliamazoniense]
MNLANKLTLLRIFLVPLFVIFMILDSNYYGVIIATIIFIIASITDKIDGYIARSRNQITNFGKFMDPLADKLLVTAALVSLVQLDVIPAWAVIIILSREFAVTGLRTIAAAEGKVIAASNWGKLKTVFQMLAIILLLIVESIKIIPSITTTIMTTNLSVALIEYIPLAIFYIAVIITIISGWDYFVKNKGIISTDK